MSDNVLEPSATTDDRFLGGRLVLRQPKRGHRAGHDAMLLAAVTEAGAEAKVVDLGAGVGAAGLAVAQRCGRLELILIEVDPCLAELARFNAQSNGIPAQVITADVTSRNALRAAGLAAGSADCVLMNPPFHGSDRHRASPDIAKRVAHRADGDTLPAWVSAAHHLLRSRGVLTLIWRADELPQVFEALRDRFGSLELQAVHSAPDRPAVRVLLRAVKDGRAPLAIHGPAILDGSDAAVDAALRGDEALMRTARPKATREV